MAIQLSSLFFDWVAKPWAVQRSLETRSKNKPTWEMVDYKA